MQRWLIFRCCSVKNSFETLPGRTIAAPLNLASRGREQSLLWWASMPRLMG